MHKRIAVGAFVAMVGSAVLTDPKIACGQVEGALQYPPRSVGEDALPPPPAGIVPQIVPPRPTELGISGSTQAPVYHPYSVHLPAGIDRFALQPGRLPGASPVTPPIAGGS